MASLEVNFDDQTWWRDWHLSPSNNLGFDGCDGGHPLMERLEQFHQDCIGRFYDDSISKKHFFQVCCLFWTEHFLHGNGATDPPISVTTSKELFEALKATYTNIMQQSDMCLIRWILPFESAMNVVFEQLDTFDDEKREDGYFLSLVMEFWSQLFDACNKDSASSGDAAESDENQRPNKRRRLLERYVDRTASTGSSKSYGRHNLQAAVFLLSVTKQRCKTWDQLYQWSKKLAETFPTFSSNTVQTAMALVGLNCIWNDEHVDGLSVVHLFDTYFISDAR
jgi:hypothetical protein